MRQATAAEVSEGGEVDRRLHGGLASRAAIDTAGALLSVSGGRPML
jgi:hypothetical protein